MPSPPKGLGTRACMASRPERRRGSLLPGTMGPPSRDCQAEIGDPGAGSPVPASGPAGRLGCAEEGRGDRARRGGLRQAQACEPDPFRSLHLRASFPTCLVKPFAGKDTSVRPLPIWCVMTDFVIRALG